MPSLLIGFANYYNLDIVDNLSSSPDLGSD
jgi:hypothetical protein